MSQSVERALDLIELIADGHATLDELAGLTDVHKSTVLRTLRVLETRGYATRDAKHRYRIGPRLYLFPGRPGIEAVRSTASAALRALGRRTGQTVHLAAYDDGVVSYIDKVEARSTLRMYSRIGLPAPLHATGVAKVLLGELDETELRRVLDRCDFAAFTPKTLTSADALIDEIRRSAERGWAVDHEEHETFMNCIAAGVRSADGRIVAAVSVSVPNVVLPYEQVLALLPDLHETTTAISHELGFDGPAPFILPVLPPSQGVPR